MKIVCIYPGATIPGFASLKLPGNNESNYINHGLSMLSAMLKREGHEVWLHDLRGHQSWEHIERVISEQTFDMVLISFMSCDSSFAVRCLEICKNHHPTVPTVAGGIHLSVTRPTEYPNTDCIILGEGEETIVKIAEQYQTQGSVPPYCDSKPVADLDSLPFVDRSLFNNDMERNTPLLPGLPIPFITAVFSRGCSYQCTFCWPTRQLIAGKRKRIRSVEHCLEEMYQIKETAGMGSMMVHDDLFPEDIHWLEEFSEQFLLELGRVPFWNQMRSDFICKHPDIIVKLAEAGLTWVSLGVESGSPRILQFLKKHVTVEQNIEAAEILHRNNVNIFCNYILGLPTETKEDVEATGKMLKIIEPEAHSASIYTAYPGSALYQYCLENNLFTGGHYRRTRFPYEKEVEGIDYNYVFQKISEFMQHKSELKTWVKPITTAVPTEETIEEIIPEEKKKDPKKKTEEKKKKLQKEGKKGPKKKTEEKKKKLQKDKKKKLEQREKANIVAHPPGFLEEKKEADQQKQKMKEENKIIDGTIPLSAKNKERLATEVEIPKAIPIKMRKPKVSIILTSHDRPHLVKQAIKSIFSQTLSNWELVIVDSSVKPTVETVLNRYTKDKRVLLLKEPRHIGSLGGNLTEAWNRALSAVQGRYICFLDDDNRKKKQFCEKMSEYLDTHKNYDAVACISQFIDERGKPIENTFPDHKGLNKKSILKRNYVDSGELMIRATVIDKIGYFDERLTTLDDWDMVIRLLYENNGIGLIQKALTEYRQHPARRMFKTLRFNARSHLFIQSKKRGKLMKLACIVPDREKLTKSQFQVCKGIADAIPQLPFVESCITGTIRHHKPTSIKSCDLLIVPAPFRIEVKEMEMLSQYKIPILTTHMEDPQAVRTNLERDKFASWIVANDIAAILHYRKIIDPRKVLFCPSLSISEDVLKAKPKPAKKFDVVLCGYAYDSRVEFVKQLLSKPIDFSLLLVGDDWWKKLGSKKTYRSCSIMPCQDEVTTMNIYRSAKIVVCLHRTDSDIGGFPDMAPESVHRGYIEAYSGSLVMIDNSRKQHPFGENEILFYSSLQDLREKLFYYLNHPKEAKAMAKKAQMRAARDFTFKARLTKILNCVRSERYEMIIP